MNQENKVAALSGDETKEIGRLENEFKSKYGKEVILVAYEK